MEDKVVPFHLEPEENEEDEEEKSRWEIFKEIIIEYSEYSTIAGIVYIFMEGQTLFGKVYWTTWIILLFSLGTYWSIQAYNDWQAQLVLTTATSTAIPVGEVAFPGVVFCADGMPGTVFRAGFIGLLKNYLIENKIKTDFTMSAIEISNLMVSSTLTYNMTNETQHVLTDSEKGQINIFSTLYTTLDNFNNSINVQELVFPGYKASSPHMLLAEDVMRTFNLFTMSDIDSYMDTYEINLYHNLYASNNESISPLSYYFDDSLMNQVVHWQKTNSHYHKDLYSLDLGTVFTALLSTLWYSRLPCYDVIGQTAENINDASFVKSCSWKGISLNCSSIFKTIPTDSGVCCAFNMEAAETVFTKSVYSDLVHELQQKDLVRSFDNYTLPDWYVSQQEPKSKAGSNMGLQITLDAHTDLLSALSIETDYDSFTVLVSAPGDFPMISQRGFRVLRGYRNMVALSATIINADADIVSVTPISRGCLFSNEYKLKLYSAYSQVNCLFECTLNYAQVVLKNTPSNASNWVPDHICTPWYYPFITSEQMTCSPWDSYTIVEEMAANVPDDECSYCLPDCIYFLYQHSLSTEPFRKCDDFNFGMSENCDLANPDLNYKPTLWASQVKTQLLEMDYGPDGPPSFIDNITSNFRYIYPLYELQRKTILDNTVGEYDAYLRDIAVVNVYFDTPTVWQFSTQLSSTWIVYLSNVGGLYGLCIGFSLATIVELVWLGMRIFREMKFFAPNIIKPKTNLELAHGQITKM